MDDLGAPASYVVLETGTTVYAAGGERVGRVAEIRADKVRDIFDGIVVDRMPALGDHRHLVRGEQVDEIFERGVLLKIDAQAFAALPGPG